MRTKQLFHKVNSDQEEWTKIVKMVYKCQSDTSPSLYILLMSVTRLLSQ